jgi:hypothetical protein
MATCGGKVAEGEPGRNGATRIAPLCALERLIPWLHGSPGDAKHRPATHGRAALLTMRSEDDPHPE